MNRIHLRAFALGIVFSTSLLGTYYYFFDNQHEATKLSDEELIAQVENDGYKVVKKDEYNELEKKAAEAEKAENTEQKEDTEKVETTTESEEKAEEKADPITEYKLSIISGMQTSEIASILKDAAIVDDAMNFEQYLISTGYHTKVQIGEFTLKSDMSYEQIAKIITKS